VVFLLDVLEHIPDQRSALAEVRQALTPGGILVATMPALSCFWTWNDEFAGHQRRYSKRDVASLADECGYHLVDSRYFMFFLSPLLLLNRWWTSRKARNGAPDELRRLAEKAHRVPHRAVNAMLSGVLAAETPLGHYLAFPFGTSILAVLQKPNLA
jgi:SAM-dependent methyltransferase